MPVYISPVRRRPQASPGRLVRPKLATPTSVSSSISLLLSSTTYNHRTVSNDNDDDNDNDRTVTTSVTASSSYNSTSFLICMFLGFLITASTVIVPIVRVMQQQSVLQNSIIESKHIEETSNNDNNNNVIISITPREYTPWPIDEPLPCYEAETNWISMDVQNTPSTVGFLYVKPFKTGSSTGSGINLRIARNVAVRNGYTMCTLRFDHGPDLTPGVTLFNSRSKNSSFLWTIIREPTARVVSLFFHFAVSRNNVEPTDVNFQKALQEMYPNCDYYLHALYNHGWYGNRTISNPVEVSYSILNEYNFIGITERMDESAVVLMMLLNLKLADVLYLSAKTRGGYDDGGGPNGCTVIQPSFISVGMKEYFNSYEWQNLVKYDLALYNAANVSLDKTIDRLGRTKFNKNLIAFRTAEKIASERCLPKTKFPCDEYGNKRTIDDTDCLWQDSGCGTECLDEVATELNLW